MLIPQGNALQCIIRTEDSSDLQSVLGCRGWQGVATVPIFLVGLQCLFFGNAFDNCNSFELGVHAERFSCALAANVCFLGSSIFYRVWAPFAYPMLCPPSHDLLPAAVSTSLQLVSLIFSSLGLVFRNLLKPEESPFRVMIQTFEGQNVTPSPNHISQTHVIPCV